MTDQEERIKAAANECAGRCPTYSEEDIVRRAFTKGARWMKKDMTADLWHPAKEQPKRGKWIIVSSRNRVYKAIIAADRGWEEYTLYNSICEWCYIEDIEGINK